jgi:integrase
MRNETKDRMHVKAGKVLREPEEDRLRIPDESRGHEPKEPTLRNEGLRGIRLTGGAVNGQKENPLARRRYQRGYVFLKKKQLGRVWVGRYREDVVLPDGTVKRVKRSVVLGDTKQYPTRRLALRVLEAVLSAVNSLAYRPQPTATFDQIAAKWEATVLGQLRPSTAENYRTHIRKHLSPFFGAFQGKDIGPELVQQFIASIGKKASPKTVRNIFVTLQSMWRSARAWGYVARDIFDGVVLPTAQPSQRYFLSATDVQRIITDAEEPLRTFYGLLAETAVRAGELCGLVVDDIDLERGLLLVRRSAWRGKLGSPKTPNSVRGINLSAQCVEHLRGFLQSWRPNQERLLFATRNGTPWDPNLLLKRKFRPLLKRLGIDVPRGNGFHAFRHANETLMDRLSVPLRLRQERLGHRDPRLTLSVYTHVVSEDARRVAGQLGDAIWGQISAP